MICVIDTSNLERNLYLLSQIIDLQYPVIVALNMMDVAEQEGMEINTSLLSTLLGVTIVPTIGSKGIGVDRLLTALRKTVSSSPNLRKWSLPEKVRMEHDELITFLVNHDKLDERIAYHEAQSLLSTPHDLSSLKDQYSETTLSHLRKDHENLDGNGIDRFSKMSH